MTSKDAFTRYKAATGAVMDVNTGLLKLTTAQYNALQSLFFTIGGVRFVAFEASTVSCPSRCSLFICLVGRVRAHEKRSDLASLGKRQASFPSLKV
jgi:hypothetical protein